METNGIGDRAAHADGVPVVDDLDARLVGANQHVEEPVGEVGGAVQQAPGEVVGGAGGKRAEVFGAVEPVPAVLVPDGGAYRQLVAEGAPRLAGDGREDGPVIHHRLEEVLLLIRAGELKEEVDDGTVHVEGEPGGGASLGDPGQDHRVGEGVGADAAVLPGHGQRQQPGVPKILVVLEGEPRFPVDGLRPDGELLPAQGLGHLNPSAELFWNLECHHECGGGQDRHDCSSLLSPGIGMGLPPPSRAVLTTAGLGGVWPARFRAAGRAGSNAAPAGARRARSAGSGGGRSTRSGRTTPPPDRCGR